jgi:Sec-independent protein translocase protein TatA
MSLAEIFFLALLGLVIFGPKKLVTVAQQAGQTLARLKKVSSDFQTQLQSEISAAPSARSTKQSPVVASSEK